jgi:hypothetical protein
MGNDRKMRKRPRDHDRATRSQTDKEGSSSTKPNYDETIRRPDWDDDVREKIFKEAQDPYDDNLYICALTGNSYPKNMMQVDHVENWEDWCSKKADLDNPGQMFKAYNDPKNLRLIHRGVNASKGKKKQPGKNYLANL